MPQGNSSTASSSTANSSSAYFSSAYAEPTSGTNATNQADICT